MSGPGDPPGPDEDRLVAVLRAAGCVFAEEEAAELRRAAPDPRRLEGLVRRRLDGEPLEHVVGRVGFHGLRLAVGPGVFVPRQRSSLLADVALAAVRAAAHATGRPPVFLEAFAGVAPLAAVVRAGAPGASVHATDLDGLALRHARANLGPDVPLYRGAVLSGLPRALRGRLDVIAAVPPYVPDGAAALLPREARRYEPARALFGGPDGLEHVRALLAEAPGWLRPAGRLLLESGADQAAEVRDRHLPPGHRARIVPGEDGRTVVLDVIRAG
ncbi:SAM-dependent methyltransferase [Citricoccus sp. SGAir0253]|nr:SAM-dependent methyltransferase [Citricoccus sp. SGAir0253]